MSSTFLPQRTLSSPEEEEKIESGSFSLQGYSLLIVEDKQDLREFLKMLLRISSRRSIKQKMDW